MVKVSFDLLDGEDDLPSPEYMPPPIPSQEKSRKEETNEALIEELLSPTFDCEVNPADASEKLLTDESASELSGNKISNQNTVVPAHYRDNYSGGVTFERLSRAENPLIKMLMRFIGDTYFLGGPRPQMLADFARHLQCLEQNSNNYHETLKNFTPLDLTKFANNKAACLYIDPRNSLRALNHDTLVAAQAQFKQVLGTLGSLKNSDKPEDKALLKRLHQAEKTIKVLNTPVSFEPDSTQRDQNKANSRFSF